jgi:ribosomal protein L40E
MVTCPACGKENEDSAYECKRCRAPLREGEPEGSAPEGGALGSVCRRCEAFNEAGVTACTNCGAPLGAGAAPQGDAAQVFTPPSQVPETLSEELRALAISDEEAAEAGLTMGRSADKTPPEPFVPPPPNPRAQTSAVAGSPASVGRRPPPAPPPPRAQAAEPPPATLPGKPCTNCNALNPPAAKFCFDCGTPFVKKTSAPPPPSIEVAAELPAETFEDPTMESSAVAAEAAWAAAEPAAAQEEVAAPEAWAAEEAVPAESVAEPIPEEQPPPFAARLVLENGNGQGHAFDLAHLENSLGGSAAHVGLGEDPFVAPHAATLAFVDERLVLRDEGSANGVYVKVRDSAALVPGDLFVAGERLLRYDGPIDVPRAGESDPPLLGAPRPADGTLVRVTEVLAGARTGRTCHRAGPAITIGRSGCDMNFPADSLLAAKHAEIRLAADGSATLADLGQGPAGVFLRVRAQQPVDLQAGDIVRVGDQQLRVEVG